MDTKLKADISEQAVILRLLELGLNVLRPIGDRLAYDFSIVHIPNTKIFYVVPISHFLTYRSEITFSEDAGARQRPSSYEFREAWHFLAEYLFMGKRRQQ